MRSITSEMKVLRSEGARCPRVGNFHELAFNLVLNVALMYLRYFTLRQATATAEEHKLYVEFVRHSQQTAKITFAKGTKHAYPKLYKRLPS